MTDRLLRDRDVALVTGLGRTTRYEMERRGEFPRRRQIGRGAVGWLESEILEWLRTRELGRIALPVVRGATPAE
jgi:prophage regulatory protein